MGTAVIECSAEETSKLKAQREVLKQILKYEYGDDEDLIFAEVFTSIYEECYDSVTEMQEYETTESLAALLYACTYFYENLEEDTYGYFMALEVFDALQALEDGNIDSFQIHMERSMRYYNSSFEEGDGEELDDTILKIQESEENDSNLPDYDISGTVNDVTESTFKITTSKGNVYTFNYSDTELNVGETVKFHYKGEISSSDEVQPVKVSNMEVTAAAPAGAEYETGITYSDLSRNPDDYEGKLVKFKGTIVQLIEDISSDEIQIRFAVNDDYDQIIYCGYDKSIVSSRVLEDDWITIYGQSVGLISYESTLGGTITIPAVWIDRIDQ